MSVVVLNKFDILCLLLPELDTPIYRCRDDKVSMRCYCAKVDGISMHKRFGIPVRIRELVQVQLFKLQRFAPLGALLSRGYRHRPHLIIF